MFEKYTIKSYLKIYIGTSALQLTYIFSMEEYFGSYFEI